MIPFDWSIYSSNIILRYDDFTYIIKHIVESGVKIINI